MSQARIFAPIQVAAVENGQYGAYAKLRQEVSQPSSGSSFNNIAGLEAFAKPSSLRPQVRTFLLTVADGTTQEDLQKAFDSMENAKLYRRLSCYPTVDPSQQRRINEGQTTLEAIAERQLIRDKDNNVVMFKAADETEHMQYGVNFLDTTGSTPDVDSRQEDVDNGELYIVGQADAVPAIATATPAAVGAVPAPIVAEII